MGMSMDLAPIRAILAVKKIISPKILLHSSPYANKFVLSKGHPNYTIILGMVMNQKTVNLSHLKHNAIPMGQYGCQKSENSKFKIYQYFKHRTTILMSDEQDCVKSIFR